MTIQASTISRLKSIGTRRDRLGIDVGTATIKMARMEWSGGRWTIANRLILPLEQPGDDDEASLTDGALQRCLAILKRRSLSNTHDSVCVVPMQETDIRSVEVPPGTRREVEQMATEALRDLDTDFAGKITRLWQHTHTPHDMAMVSGVSVSSDVAEQMVTELDEVGLSCDRLETVPFVLARAAAMSQAGQGKRPVALLDWGHSGVTFIISNDGRPEFVRSLRDCNGRSAIQTLANGLKMSVEDTQAVLADCGLPGTDGGHSGSALARTIEQFLMPEILRVTEELGRTLLYLRHHVPQLLPSRLILFGGMATIANIDDPIEKHSGLETTPWSLNHDNSHSTDPMYAAALAASAAGTRP